MPLCTVMQPEQAVGDRAKEQECMRLPQRKWWEDFHSQNDPEAKAVILMWHLLEHLLDLLWGDFLS